jgi:DNA-binding transcriptional LysR family regulator
MLKFLKIKYFLEVAELRSFTKAAELNFISQTAVSQHISGLEKELKVRLFKREKGRVELTKAGESFYRDCKEILEAYNKAVFQARRIFNETLDRQTVTIGYLGSSVIEYLDDILTEFNQREGGQNLDIKPVQEHFQTQRLNLKNGILDMAIGPTFNFEGLEKVRSIELYKQKVGLLVSRKSPLAKLDSVRISDIRDLPVVMTAPAYSGASYDRFLQRRAEEGFTPRISEWADSAEMQMILGGMNKGGS